jgi:hypothetical protein
MSTLHDQPCGLDETLRGFTSAYHVRQSLLRGEPGVKVLMLNLALDRLGSQTANKGTAKDG